MVSEPNITIGTMTDEPVSTATGVRRTPLASSASLGVEMVPFGVTRPGLDLS